MTALITVTFIAAILYTVTAFICYSMASICQRHKAMMKSIVEDAIAIQVEAERYAAISVKELRDVCSRMGIRWRNAHGKNKHLSKAEMLLAIA